MKGALLVAAAAVLWSTGGLIVRSLEVADGPTTVFWRSLTACVFLLLLVVVRERGGALRSFQRMGWPGLVVAACYAVASTALVVAFRLTSVANALVIMSSTPMLAAVLGWLLLGEKPSKATWGATLACVVGIAIMTSESYARGTLAGDGAAALIAIVQAIAGVTIRRFHAIQMAPAMCVSTAVTTLGAAAFASPLAVTAGDLALLTVFGAGQLGLGLALFSFGAPLIPVAQVALINVVEPILGPVWVWLFLGEQPGRGALFGGAIVLCALAVSLIADHRSARRPGTSPRT